MADDLRRSCRDGTGKTVPLECSGESGDLDTFTVSALVKARLAVRLSAIDDRH
jgi:hypothetical protein